MFTLNFSIHRMRRLGSSTFSNQKWMLRLRPHIGKFGSFITIIEFILNNLALNFLGVHSLIIGIYRYNVMFFTWIFFFCHHFQIIFSNREVAQLQIQWPPAIKFYMWLFFSFNYFLATLKTFSWGLFQGDSLDSQGKARIV